MSNDTTTKDLIKQRTEDTNALNKQIGGRHYTSFEIQPIEFIYKNDIPAIEASAIKYIIRHRFKNGAEDIKKAIHVLQILLELEYNE